MSPPSPAPRPGILDIEAYVPGESSVPGGVKPIKLSSNETPLGPSPKAIAAYQAVAGELERYPDGSATALRSAIAAPLWPQPGAHRMRRGLRRAPDAAGARLSRRRATRRFSPSTAFSSTASSCWRTARRPSWRRRPTHRTDVDAILARVTERTKVVFLANPEQSDRHLRAVRRGAAACGRSCRRNVLLVLDAAYAEYVRAQRLRGRASSSSRPRDNTVMTRTFSKIYGLARRCASAGPTARRRWPTC